MRVKQLAEVIGVTGDTARYYTRIGFLKPNKAPANGYKEYGAKDRRVLRFILSARQLRFSVKDIGEIIHTSEQGMYRTTFRQIVENLFWAWFYNLAAIPIAAVGLLHPMIGVIAMIISSLSVIGNSLRLKRVKLNVDK